MDELLDKHGDLIYVTVGFVVVDVMTDNGLVLERVRTKDIQSIEVLNKFESYEALLKLETNDGEYSLRISKPNYDILVRCVDSMRVMFNNDLVTKELV